MTLGVFLDLGCSCKRIIVQAWREVMEVVDSSEDGDGLCAQ